VLRNSSSILDLSTRWRRVVSFTPRPLYPRETDPCIRWIRSWVGPCGEEKFYALLGIERRPSSASLYRLSYPDSSYCIYKKSMLKWFWVALCAWQTDSVLECIIGVGEIQLGAESPPVLARYWGSSKLSVITTMLHAQLPFLVYIFTSLHIELSVVTLKALISHSIQWDEFALLITDRRPGHLVGSWEEIRRKILERNYGKYSKWKGNGSKSGFAQGQGKKENCARTVKHCTRLNKTSETANMNWRLFPI
jgi:hypothetical protein